MVQPRKYVAGPTAVPLPFGLQSVSLVSDDADPHAGFGIEFQTTNCGVARRDVAACFDDANPPAGVTLLPDDGVPVVTADPFSVYALHTCRNLGGNAEAGQRARDILARGEWRAIEEGFAEGVLVDADDLTPTPGTPVSRIEALGLLEEFAAATYGSVPIIHVSRLTGTQLYAARAIDRFGTRLETGQGATVASGAGYGSLFETLTVDTTTPGAGERWIFVTGAVVVHRGIVGTSQVTQEQTGSPRRYTNELAVLAQRSVSAAAECLIGAVLVGEAA